MSSKEFMTSENKDEILFKMEFILSSLDFILSRAS